jgi:hypothetical protein
MHDSQTVKHLMSLDWSVHVVRMSDDRIVKKVFLGENHTEEGKEEDKN